jgi:hypothetical protein
MINWKAKKKVGMRKDMLVKLLKDVLPKTEWFVTGNVDPSIFADSFRFQDPDVKVTGIEQYARGVNKLFKQGDAHAEILSVDRFGSNSIMITWILSGSVNIGLGVRLKPFIVNTEYQVSEVNGLIVFQEDKFAIPGWDILLSAFFPFLIPLLSPPATSSNTSSR